MDKVFAFLASYFPLFQAFLKLTLKGGSTTGRQITASQRHANRWAK